MLIENVHINIGVLSFYLLTPKLTPIISSVHVDSSYLRKILTIVLISFLIETRTDPTETPCTHMKPSLHRLSVHFWTKTRHMSSSVNRQLALWGRLTSNHFYTRGVLYSRDTD